MSDELNPTLDEAAAQIQKLTESAYQKLVKRILAGESPQPVIQEIQEAWGGQYKTQLAASFSTLLDKAIGSNQVSEMPIGEMSLSQKLYNHSQAVTSVVKTIVENHAKGMAEASKLSMDIYEGYGFKAGKGGEPLLVKAGLPKYLKEALAEPTYKAALSKVLTMGQAASIKTPALKAAYMAAVKAVEAGPGSEILAKATRIAFFERNRYFANRIAQTELARAHSDKKAAEILADDAIEYVQIKMSGTHPRVDICDLHAKVDKYGLGAGVYPKALAPKPPFHPFCRCKASPRIDLVGLVTKDNPEAHREFVSAQPKGIGAAIMGSKAKRSAFVRGEQSLEEVIDAKKPDPYKSKTLAEALGFDQIASKAKAKAAEELQAKLEAELQAIAKAEAEAKLKKAQDDAAAAALAAKIQQEAAAAAYAAKIKAEIDAAAKAAETAAHEAQKAAWAAKSLLQAYQKSLLAGKKPTAKQQAAYDAADDAKKASIKASVDAIIQPIKVMQSTQVAQAALDSTAEINAEGWKEYAKKTKGSNPGAFYRDEHGAEWFVKFPPSEAAAHNEVLASKLYKLARVDAIEMHIVRKDGKVAVASRVINGIEESQAKVSALDSGAWRGFGTDAWLANWDVAGLSFDNTVLVNGKALRIDVGGSLIFRAQGGLKGKAFGETVDEITSLRGASNKEAKALFAALEDAHVKASVAHVLSLSPESIRETVMRYGPGSLAERSGLANQLIARQTDLAKRFPDVQSHVSDAVRIAADAVTTQAKTDAEEASRLVIDAIKSVSSRAAKGGTVESPPYDKTNAARKAYDALIAKHGAQLSAKSRSEIEAHFEPWLKALETSIAPGLNAKIYYTAPSSLNFEIYGKKLSADLSRVVVTYEPWMFGLKGGLFTEAQAKAIMDAKRKGFIPTERTGWEPIWKHVPYYHRASASYWTSNAYDGVYDKVVAGTVSKDDKAWMDLIDQAIGIATRYKGQSARGIAPSDLKKTVGEYMAAYKSGGTVEMLTPASSKRGEIPLWHYKNPSSDMVLHFDDSTRGAYVTPIAVASTSEDEVLFPRGKYRVLKEWIDPKTKVQHFLLGDE